MTRKNPLLRRSQPKPAHNPYARFGLRENPFPNSPTVTPDSPDPRVNGEIYCAALRQNEDKLFERLLIPNLTRNGRSIAFLMDYATRYGRGIGKTAFLNHQRRRVMADLGDELTEGANVLLAAHLIPEAGRTRKFWQFTRSMAESLNKGDCIAWALWRLRAFSGVIPDEVIDQVDYLNPGPRLGNDEWLQDQGVDVLFTLNKKIEKTLLQEGIKSETAKALASAGHDPEAWENFISSKSDYWWRKEGHQLVFDDLVRLFRAAGFDKTLLLVDEVEKIVIPQNSQEKRIFVDELRRFLIDGPFQSVYTRFYSLLFTIHPYIQELWVPLWNATGLDRVCPIGGATTSEFTIYFYPLTAEKAAVPLVLTYLDHYRTEANLRGSLKPFDEESVVEALNLSKGVPGPMLMLLRLVLEKAIEKNWTTINAKKVRLIYENAIPSEPPDEDETRPLRPVLTNLMEKG